MNDAHSPRPDPQRSLAGRRRVLRAAAAWPALTVLPQVARAAATTPRALGQVVDWPTLELLDGRRLVAADWRDTAAVVVFWETTCPFCRRHNAHVDKLHRASEGKRLRVLTVARDRDPALVRQYLSSQGYGFPVTLQEGALRAQFSARRVVPLTCSVGRDGRLREVIPGEMFEEDVLALTTLAD